MKPTGETMEDGKESSIDNNMMAEHEGKESKYEHIDSFLEGLSDEEKTYLKKCLNKEPEAKEEVKEEEVLSLTDFEN